MWVDLRELGIKNLLIVFFCFYDCYGKSIITYEILVYGTVAKETLELNKQAQRRILKALSHKKHYSLQAISKSHKLVTVFGLFLREVLMEVFKDISRAQPAN